MFQLEQKMNAWKQRLGQSEAVRAVDLAELEQHLRDSITHLRATGLNEEEAFLVAVHRTGDPHQIASEFRQVNGGHIWAQRVFWMIAGIIFFVLWKLVIGSVTLSSQAVVALIGGSGTSMGMVASIVSAVCWFGLAIAVYRCTHIERDAISLRELLRGPRVRTLSLVAGAVVLLSAFLTFTGRVVVARYVPVSEVGKSALIMHFAEDILEIVVPAAFLFVMWKLQTKLLDTASVES